MLEPVKSNRRPWQLGELALACGAGVLSFCTGGPSYADPLSLCSGVNQTANVQLMDASGTTDYSYDSVNRIITATEGSAVTMYAYDAVDRVIQATDPSSDKTQYQYDSLDRRINEIDPLGATTVYQYDAGGNITSTTDPGGNITTYSYNSNGRIRSDSEGAQSVTDFVYISPVLEPSSLALLLVAALARGLGLSWKRLRGPPGSCALAPSRPAGART